MSNFPDHGVVGNMVKTCETPMESEDFLDFKRVAKENGFQSSENDSDSNSKLELDQDYEDMKPSPYVISPKTSIIEIRATKNQRKRLNRQRRARDARKIKEQQNDIVRYLSGSYETEKVENTSVHVKERDESRAELRRKDVLECSEEKQENGSVQYSSCADEVERSENDKNTSNPVIEREETEWRIVDAVECRQERQQEQKQKNRAVEYFSWADEVERSEKENTSNRVKERDGAEWRIADAGGCREERKKEKQQNGSVKYLSWADEISMEEKQDTNDERVAEERIKHTECREARQKDEKQKNRAVEYLSWADEVERSEKENTSNLAEERSDTEMRIEDSIGCIEERKKEVQQNGIVKHCVSMSEKDQNTSIPVEEREDTNNDRVAEVRINDAAECVEERPKEEKRKNGSAEYFSWVDEIERNENDENTSSPVKEREDTEWRIEDAVECMEERRKEEQQNGAVEYLKLTEEISKSENDENTSISERKKETCDDKEECREEIKPENSSDHEEVNSAKKKKKKKKRRRKKQQSVEVVDERVDGKQQHEETRNEKENSAIEHDALRHEQHNVEINENSEEEEIKEAALRHAEKQRAITERILQNCLRVINNILMNDVPNNTHRIQSSLNDLLRAMHRLEMHASDDVGYIYHVFLEVSMHYGRFSVHSRKKQVSIALFMNELQNIVLESAPQGFKKEDSMFNILSLMFSTYVDKIILCVTKSNQVLQFCKEKYELVDSFITCPNVKPRGFSLCDELNNWLINFFNRQGRVERIVAKKSSSRKNELDVALVEDLTQDKKYCDGTSSQNKETCRNDDLKSGLPKSCLRDKIIDDMNRDRHHFYHKINSCDFVVQSDENKSKKLQDQVEDMTSEKNCLFLHNNPNFCSENQSQNCPLEDHIIDDMNRDRHYFYHKINSCDFVVQSDDNESKKLQDQVEDITAENNCLILHKKVNFCSENLNQNCPLEDQIIDDMTRERTCFYHKEDLCDIVYQSQNKSAMKSAPTEASNNLQYLFLLFCLFLMHQDIIVLFVNVFWLFFYFRTLILFAVIFSYLFHFFNRF